MRNVSVAEQDGRKYLRTDPTRPPRTISSPYPTAPMTVRSAGVTLTQVWRMRWTSRDFEPNGCSLGLHLVSLASASPRIRGSPATRWSCVTPAMLVRGRPSRQSCHRGPGHWPRSSPIRQFDCSLGRRGRGSRLPWRPDGSPRQSCGREPEMRSEDFRSAHCRHRPTKR